MAAFGLTTEGDRTVVMPYGEAKKYRKGFEKEDRSFWWDPPNATGQHLFLPPNYSSSTRHVVVVEGETDTMRLWQALGQARGEAINVVGLPGAYSWKPHFAAAFEGAERVYVVLDNDDPYNKQATSATDKCWAAIRRDLGPRAKRARLPGGTKDICEFFDAYDLDAFRHVLKTAAEHKFHFAPIDLTQPAPELDWLMEPLLHRGDLHLLAGVPGHGKSYLAMGLAVSIAEGRSKYLDCDVKAGDQKVLYLDQENPEGEVRRRLDKLGLSEAGQKNMHYLSGHNIKLEKDTGRLMEDIQALEPTLAVFDTLRKLHVGDENKSDEMERLFDGFFEPVSRELGVTCLVLHHTGRMGHVMGSTRIEGAPDVVLTQHRNEEVDNMYHLDLHKTRYGALNLPVTYTMDDVGSLLNFTRRGEAF